MQETRLYELTTDQRSREIMIGDLLLRYGFLSRDTIGESRCGRPIDLLSVGNRENQVLFAASFHGMESITTLLTLAASAALASVPQKSLYLGGIGIGSEGSYVRQIYGAPTETEREHSASHPSGSVVEYEYGDGVSLHLAEGVVYQVEVSANNGWATPEGIHVGMDASLLEGTYGKPDMVRGDKIIYRAEGLSGVGLIFEIEKGKIDEIEIGPIQQ